MGNKVPGVLGWTSVGAHAGEVSGQEGESVRTCINAPEGPVEIEL